MRPLIEAKEMQDAIYGIIRCRDCGDVIGKREGRDIVLDRFAYFEGNICFCVHCKGKMMPYTDIELNDLRRRDQEKEKQKIKEKEKEKSHD